MLVTCPLCKAGTGEAKAFTFAATTVEVVPCSTCIEATGIVSIELRKSSVLELCIRETVAIHADGLVAFGASA